MNRTNKWANLNVRQLILDGSMLFVCFIASWLLADAFTHLFHPYAYFWIGISFSAVWLFGMSFYKMYDITTFYYNDRILRNVIKSSFLAGVFIVVTLFLLKLHMYSRIFIVLYIIFTTVVMLAERYFTKYYLKTRSPLGQETIHSLVVGSEDQAAKYLNYLAKTALRNQMVGYVRLDESTPISERCLGELENLEVILKNNIIDQVVFAIPHSYVTKIEPYVLLCETMGITVKLLSDFYNFQNSQYYISMLGPIPILTFYTVSLNPVQMLLKRAMDILGAIVGLFITAVISLVVIPAILIDSHGPVFYKQTRVGKNGREFQMYKFRTMYAGSDKKKHELLEQNRHSDGRFFKIENDPRITRIGAILRKLSIDELPQFLNVLRGDMSLVGTRPPLLDEVSQYNLEDFRRISIKPGMTGMWQISGRSDVVNFDDIVGLDTQYIDNWSISLDIYILFRTVFQVFVVKTAY